MPDDDIAARLRDIANQMTDVVTIGHEDDPFFSGGEIADVEEAADLIDSLCADNARLATERDAALAEVERLRGVVGWWRLRSDALADDLRNASDNGYDGASTARLLAVNHEAAPDA